MPINTHPISSEQIMAYFDGEATPEQALEVAAHLAVCRECQGLAAELESVESQMAAWTVETRATEMPPAVAAALEQRLQQAPVKRKKPAWFAGPLKLWTTVAAAGIPIAAVLAVLIFSRHTTQTVRAPSAPAMDVAAALDTLDEPSKLQMGSGTKGTAVTVARYEVRQPAVVRTAALTLTANNFASIRADIERLALQYGGHIARLESATPTDGPPSLTADLRVPTSKLDAALGALRNLGRVQNESQRGEEVSRQVVDLEARLANERHTEERLTDILRWRTGRLSEVLEVEEKLAQVRGEIETAEAEQKNLNDRIVFATISLTVSDVYHRPLTGQNEIPIYTRLANAAADGVLTAFHGLVSVAQALLEALPSLLLIGLALALPARLFWRKYRSP